MQNVLSSAALGGMVLVAAACGAAADGAARSSEPKTTKDGAARAVIDQTVQTLQGESLDLATFRGRPMLIVNTASQCGYTPQYAGLQKLHETYGERGLVVIGFPSNDFGGQEPGTAEEIASFCRLNYGVSFPMMAKVRTKGPEQDPVYRTLTTETGEGIRGEIRWNFTKFLIDRDGRVVARFEPGVEPTDPKLTAAIEALLPAS
ncbi:MAG: glutathione peroxidase [Thermoanaerobaculales bacterium]|jgi:glutathione peroxidase|nr:glutathione peroxidase [Thermoanaerobaculales bacterium]